MNPYFYVFVRTDIPPADQMCQAIHAAATAGKWFKHANTTNLVCLGVPSLDELKKVEDKCSKHDIQFFTHFEPDDDLKECALATATVFDEKRRVFSGYPLWKPPAALES